VVVVVSVLKLGAVFIWWLASSFVHLTPRDCDSYNFLIGGWWAHRLLKLGAAEIERDVGF
jgi:hypothetical protein